MVKLNPSSLVYLSIQYMSVQCGLQFERLREFQIIFLCTKSFDIGKVYMYFLK